MASSGQIGGLVLLLIVVMFAFFAVATGVVSFEEDVARTVVVPEREEVQDTWAYVEVIGEREIPNRNVVISDKYVVGVDPNSNAIVLSSDGEAYNVKGGTVLASDVVIKSDEGEFYVYRVNDPEKSINY